ncbi:hypothetical protein T4D_14815 [Trichinella pseudospiralis]|uniref:Uncharacterized protein n=1 Tax=Trichinella pseudospiralis TaxID=6337 RepID=A0A0V1F939_TRIPS|nr:hypothetical protein T4D_14815 [Trichinella pseudospiralis]
MTNGIKLKVIKDKGRFSLASKSLEFNIRNWFSSSLNISFQNLICKTWRMMKIMNKNSKNKVSVLFYVHCTGSLDDFID